MTLTLYFHPFSSFCQKVLIALYENETPFEGRVIDLGDPASRAELERVWPLAKFPVLRDEGAGLTVPESGLIIEYLAQRHRGAVGLIPEEPAAALKTRILDRFFDNYVNVPMQKAVTDNFRPEGRADPQGVKEAKALLAKAYDIVDSELSHGGWAAGETFTMADCAAAPALFYANIVLPFAERRNLAAYYERLLTRASFQRAIEGGRPYRQFFPLEWPGNYA
jgi:glutathione S-transferase